MPTLSEDISIIRLTGSLKNQRLYKNNVFEVLNKIPKTNFYRCKLLTLKSSQQQKKNFLLNIRRNEWHPLLNKNIRKDIQQFKSKKVFEKYLTSIKQPQPQPIIQLKNIIIPFAPLPLPPPPNKILYESFPSIESASSYKLLIKNYFENDSNSFSSDGLSSSSDSLELMYDFEILDKENEEILTQQQKQKLQEDTWIDKDIEIVIDKLLFEADIAKAKQDHSARLVKIHKELFNLNKDIVEPLSKSSTIKNYCSIQ